MILLRQAGMARGCPQRPLIRAIFMLLPTIAQTPAAITVTDEQQRARTLTPTGKREKQTVGSASLDVATRCEGPQLVSEQDLGGLT
jgi:hypothetical protein